MTPYDATKELAKDIHKLISKGKRAKRNIPTWIGSDGEALFPEGAKPVSEDSKKQGYHDVEEFYKDDPIDLSQPDKVPKTKLRPTSERVCNWTNNGEYYDTSCDEAYCLIDGTLSENKHLYCPYCGGRIKELNQ